MNKLAFGALFVGLMAACGGGNGKPKIVDAPPSDTGSGPGQCDVLTQMGCDPGQKCSWIIDQEMPTELGHVGCAQDGTVDVGGACMYGAPGTTGFDNCKAGLACIHGTCKTICDQNGGTPSCDTAHTCEVYYGFLGPAGMEAGGVCDALCNPLTDNDFDGSGTKSTAMGTACASDEGCYGEWDPARIDSPTHSQEFSCAEYANAGSSTYYANATVCDGDCSANGGPFINSCAPGYVPLFIEMTGSQTVICSAFCQPANCYTGTAGTADNTNCGGAGSPARIGATPYQCNNTHALGTFDGNLNGDQCEYGWSFEFDKQGNFHQSPYGDTTGICFDHAKYKLFDSTGMGDSTTTIPACANLPLTGSGSNCYGAGTAAGAAGSADISGCTAADFGCVDSTLAGLGSGSGSASPSPRALAERRAKLFDWPRLPYHLLRQVTVK